MRLTLAAAALVAASGVAFAQGTSTTGTTTGTTTPGTASPGTAGAPVMTPGTNVMGTPGMASPTTAGGAQTPAATVNTTPQSTSRSPSALQTTNTAHRTGASPVPGRNSFTMAQANRRIAAAGYSNVTGLKKDGQGIWRGQAQKDGNPTAVSLDYQGNVTGQ